MSGLNVLWVIAGLLQVGEPPATVTAGAGSYLYEPAYAIDHGLRGCPTPYALQPGDICFAVNNHVMSRLGHQLSGAGLPNHSMLVFAAPNGELRIVEAGYHSELKIRVNEAYCHIKGYEEEGSRVWVRRRKTPLTPEQNAAVAEFCQRQADKPFPALRTLGQLTPFRSRAPFRTEWVGKPDPDQRSYFCSELVLNALAYGCVLDGEILRPSATYPSDIFYSASKNRWVDRGVKLIHCDWDPPARWVSCINGPTSGK